MGIELSELLTGMAVAGLSLRRAPSGEVTIVGNIDAITDKLRLAVQKNYAAIQNCLPPAPPSNVEAKHDAAQNIQEQLDEFGIWLFTDAQWAVLDKRRTDDIDTQICESVATNDPQQVAATIRVLRSHLENINWASEVFP